MLARIIVVAIVLLAVWPQQALARYIDPGTGSMILQAAVAGIAGAALVLRTYWHRLRSLFSRTPQDTEQE